MIFITTKRYYKILIFLNRGYIIVYDNIKQKIIKEFKTDHSSINCICFGNNEDFFITGCKFYLKIII
jgi:hypothetical protein